MSGPSMHRAMCKKVACLECDSLETRTVEGDTFTARFTTFITDRFIEDFQRRRAGKTPTYPQIMGGLGLKSKNGVNRMVTALQERGFIARERFVPGERSTAQIVVLKSVLGTSVKPIPGRIPIFDADTLQLRGFLPL